MTYKKFLNINNSFQYSINLQYDLGNEDKLNGYIPTKQSLILLEEYLNSILLDNNDKSTVLIGPYGKGKSHLLLLLMSLIGDIKISEKTQKNLLTKIKYVNNHTETLIQNAFKKKIKFLPIIINSSTLDLNQSFLIALNEAIKSRGLDEIKLKTYYDTVLDIINLWQKDYKNALNILSKELNNYNYELEDLIEGLKNYRSDAYKVFVNIYPKISSGIEFNPMTNTNIVKIYEEFNYALCNKYGYTGMFIIFDEFSKFIEGSSIKNKSNANDMKILQDFAELSNRSKTHQLHLSCVTHKSINEYISKIPANKVDSWRAIEGRFKEIYFTSSTKQNYELIKNTIISDENKIIEIVNKNDVIKDTVNEAFQIFQNKFDFNEYNELIALGCFPLNPVSTYILPIISEKVAQNERTIFTFISKDEKNTLRNFVNNCKEEILLEPYDIYNYFENLFKKEMFNEFIKNTWIKCDAAIKKAENSLQIKILKTLALINIVNDFENLPANEYIINLACGLINVKHELNRLKENGLIVYKKSIGIFDFMPISSINVNQKIQDTVNLKFKNITVAKELENLIKPNFVLPKKFNDNYKMIRYFKNIFITNDLLEAYDNASLILNSYNADGLIINLIHENEEEILKAKNKILKLNNKRIILKVSNTEFNYKEDLLKILAIKYLKTDDKFLSEDSSIIEQLNLLEEDLYITLNEYYKLNFNIENGSCDIYSIDKKLSLKKEKHFNRFISNICKEIFNNTVIINNELINKSEITSPILKARNKIINGILNENLELEGKGPEVTIYRATLLNKGFAKNMELDKDLNFLLNEIKDFLLKCTTEKLSFNILYENLLNDKKGIGIRKGVLPIYLACIFKDYSNQLIISYGTRGNTELDFSVETLNNINDNPKDYFLKIDQSTKEREIYLNNLKNLFNEFINDKKFITTRYMETFKGIQSWIQSLDKYTRTHLICPFKNENKELSKTIIKLRKQLVKFDVNPRVFLFEKMLNILEVQSYDECFTKLKSIKEYLDNFIVETKKFLINNTVSILTPNYTGSLKQSINLWIDKINDSKLNHLYNNITNNFINYIKNIDTSNDNYIVSKLAFILTSLNIEDWNDSTLLEYNTTLITILKTISEYEIAITKDDPHLFNITLNSSKDEKVEKNFKKQEISLLGNALMNDLKEIFSEYGESIDDNEKRNILIEMLKTYM